MEKKYTRDQIKDAIWQELQESDYAGENNDRAYEVIGIVMAGIDKIVGGDVRAQAAPIYGPNEYPDLSSATPEVKAETISGLIELAAKEVLKMFYAFGLKTHIECTVINDPTKEEFDFIFRKKGTAGSQPGIDRSLIMRHAIAFANWLLPSGSVCNEKDYELFMMKPEAVLNGTAAGREDNAVTFAEWLYKNRWFSFENNKWYYTFEQGTSMSDKQYQKEYVKTTAQLYDIFKQNRNNENG